MGELRCRECGIALAPGRACRDYFHDMLGVESEVPFAQGGEPHFFAVGSYNLQHPSGFVPAALIALHRTIADVLAGQATVADARRRAGRGTAGATRVRRDESSTLSPRDESLLRAWPTEWPVTMQYVIDGGPADYVTRVRTLAQSVVSTLDGALGRAIPGGGESSAGDRP